MLAVRKMDHGPGHLSCENVPEPELKPGMVKLKIAYCGICGTDTHTYHGVESAFFPFHFPVTFGHEYSGEVIEIADDVTTLKVGDMVTARAVTGFCGNCEPCLTGRPGACVNHSATAGLDIDGAMSEYFCIEAGCCYKFPDTISAEEAAVTEPACVAVHACTELIDLKPYDTVMIMGAGPIGLLCLMAVKANGARAVMVDLSSAKFRLEKAGEIGADLVLESDKDNIPAEIRKFNGGKAADYCIDATGVAACLDTCILCTKKNGTIVEVGICDPKGITLKNFLLAILLEQRIQFSYGSVGNTWARTLDMMASGKMNVKQIITHTFPLTECQKAFDLNDGTNLKVLMHP
jgi:Threonine dehydrogenase and related Zn-dependent dehydrogenases